MAMKKIFFFNNRDHFHKPSTTSGKIAQMDLKSKSSQPKDKYSKTPPYFKAKKVPMIYSTDNRQT